MHLLERAAHVVKVSIHHLRTYAAACPNNPQELQHATPSGIVAPCLHPGPRPADLAQDRQRSRTADACMRTGWYTSSAQSAAAMPMWLTAAHPGTKAMEQRARAIGWGKRECCRGVSCRGQGGTLRMPLPPPPQDALSMMG